MKRKRKTFFLVIILCFFALYSGCSQDEKVEKLKKFIYTQVDCETYKAAAGDEEKLKGAFSDYFTEEGYQKYLDDVVGYIYPQLYYMTAADRVKIRSIVCKSVKPASDNCTTYTFEVKYTIFPIKNEKEGEVKNIPMTDQTEVTVDSDNMIKDVVLLNTGDVKAKVFFDIRIQ